MDCFYHLSEPAVAQCKRCGLFLCTYCATANSLGICKNCVAAERKKDRQSLIKCWILAIFLFVLFWNFFCQAFGGSSEVIEVSTKRSALLLSSIFTIGIAGIPFGWRRLSRKDQITGDVIIVFGNALLFGFVVKLVGSFIIGWIFMIKGFFELFVEDPEKAEKKAKNKKMEYIDPFTGKKMK